MKYRKSIVVAKLPNTGLGNKMLTYSRAFSFSISNDLQLYSVNWISFQMGALVRMERSKRIYNYFKSNGFLTKIKIWFNSRQLITESEGAKIHPFNRCYVFSEIFIGNDFFYEIREHKLLFKTAFMELLKDKIRAQIESSIAPDIAIHIRRGDFKSGSTLTELSYFIEVLNFINCKINRKLTIVVFSDGSDEELKEILEIEGVRRAIKQPDVVDLFQMTKCKIFLPSIGSTFSYWAALFNEGIIIRNELEWHTNFLSADEFNKKEFIYSKSNEMLSETLKKINFLV